MLNFIGFLLPPLIDMFNRRIPDTDVRFWVSVLVCSLFGLFVAYLQTALFEGMNIVEIAEEVAIQAMAMFGMAQLSYSRVWDKSDLRDDLGLDAKTNLKK